MDRRQATFVGCVIAAAVLIFTLHRHVSRRVLPPTAGSGESADVLRHRRAWIESMHKHAPGVDWRAMDAATRLRLGAQRAQQTELMAQGIRPAALASVPPGIWRERGAKNWAGRTSAVDYDAATDRLTVFAHGGQLWRAARSGLNWQSLNDARHFDPGSNELQNFVRLNGSGSVPERFIAADDAAHGFFYSDDDGATWTQAVGSFPTNWVETSYMAVRGVSGNQVYATVADNTTTPTQAYLLASDDRGATWTNLGAINAENKTALFALGQGSNTVFLLAGTTLSTIAANGTLSPIGTVGSTPTQTASDHVGLAGGIDPNNGNQTFLYAFYETGGTTTDAFLSSDGGSSWTQTSGTIPAVSYIRVAAGTSRSNPQVACYGSVDLYCTHNGGTSFAYVNDWPAYYTNVAGALHADISFVKSWLDASSNEVFFIGTDGGVFESTDGLATVRNDNLSGLRSGEYYASYTGRNPPYFIAIGAQDQGYQRNPDPPTGLVNHQQVLSGDYGSLTSGNGGLSLWLNYATGPGSLGTTVVDPSPAGNAQTLPQWDMASGNLDTGAMLFLPPLLAEPGHPDVALLGSATAVPTPGTGDTYQVTQLTLDGASTITFSTGAFNFGGNVTALASDGTTYFAMANNTTGGGASFFTTMTPLGNWTKTMTTLPQGAYFTGQTILVDPSQAGVIYVCGSGYSGPSVYVSADGGTTFTQMNNGLPNTLVYSLAISPDGTNLFAATEVGPYYYDRLNTAWRDITVGTGSSAPASTYWHVDFVPALNVARFSTYGRGVWDYDLGGGDLIFRDGFE